MARERGPFSTARLPSVRDDTPPNAHVCPVRAAADAAQSAASRAGSVTVNVAPSPAAERTESAPPICVTISREM